MIANRLELFVVSVGHDSVTLRAAWRSAGGRFSDELAATELSKGDRMDLTRSIHCHLVDVRGDVARIGIVAPKAVPIHRTEVWEAIRRALSDDDSEDGGLTGDRVPR